MNNKTVNIQTMIELILMYTLYFSLMKIVKTEFIKSIDITLSKEILEEIENIHLSDPNPCV